MTSSHSFNNLDFIIAVWLPEEFQKSILLHIASNNMLVIPSNDLEAFTFQQSAHIYQQYQNIFLF